MKLSQYLLPLVAILSVTDAKKCNKHKRLTIARSITTAFNEPDFAKSAELINAFPLTEDCPAIVYVDGAPGIEFGVDATTTKDFANVVRQAFVNVVSKYTDYGNGTVLMDAIVTLGVLHYVQLPIYAHITVPIEFTTDCLISRLPAHVTVPSDIAGNPVSLPMIPTIPGLDNTGGFEDILVRLATEGIVPGQLAPSA